jgi:hypothetical protein
MSRRDNPAAPLTEAHIMIGRCFRVSSVLLLAGLTIGCSRSTGNVSGTVRFNGQPLSDGTSTFYDPDNHTWGSAITKDGTYSVSQVGTGPVKVTVAVPIKIGFVPPAGTEGKTVTFPGSKSPMIPPKYNDPEKSGLGFEVIKGDQTKDFDLGP